jgi:RNA polymerase sigma-70 factor (ECF subfamily)
MNEESTTAVVQHYLNALAGDAPAEPIIREMLGRSARRLERLFANLLNGPATG